MNDTTRFATVTTSLIGGSGHRTGDDPTRPSPVVERRQSSTAAHQGHTHNRRSQS
jgi:hypothetical protein